MSEKGDKTCPLCAEEMDLTDQQLKPCKCGYDICVWCWHHIMDMAEKDGTEGRCPACRAPYDKEKIVGMAANCGRVVAEINTERKVKSQKIKAKPSEGRKQLSGVRVVQRNLVYVVGIPLNLGDEDLLQHKEYFGRYGKVLKVSMSRTTAGVIQQFPNNTCSVYITYSKEEEAARCIQAVHGFTLEGKPLRACFGTTKYCHAWLRNMPCSNPDCLYLHELGSQEDSFTKDEIFSAHTRVQEITGATTNLQCRSGNVLPPPLDENGGNCTVPAGKPIMYPSLPSSVNTVRSSPPNSSSGRPAILPSGASWGMRASSSQPSMISAVMSDALSKQKANATSVPVASSSAAASTVPMTALHSDLRKKLTLVEENHHSQAKEKLDASRGKQDESVLVNSSLAQNVTDDERSSEVHRPITKDHVGSTVSMPTHKMEDITKKSCGPAPEKSAWDDDLTDDNSSLSNDKNKSNGYHSIPDVRNSAGNVSDAFSGNLEKSQTSGERLREIAASVEDKQLTSSESATAVETFEGTSIMPSLVLSTAYAEVDEDVRSFNSQRLQDSQIVTSPSHLSNLTAPLFVSNSAREPPILTDDMVSIKKNGNPTVAGINAHEGSQVHASSTRVMSNGYNVNFAGENGHLFPNGEGSHMTRFESHVDNALFSPTDLRENIIISDILSMDFESDSSLAALTLARLFSDVDEQHASQMLSTSWNGQSNNNQSRFSFARQEESGDQTYAESSNPSFQQSSFSHNIIESRNQYMANVGHTNSIGFNNFEEYNTPYCNQAAFSSNRSPASRASPVSAPPGFSIPNRTVPPPPGFNSFERADQTFNAQPGHVHNHSFFRSSPQAPPTGNMFSNNDIEFMDPAILAVGKGRLPVVGNNGNLDMRSNFPSELGAFDNDSRLNLLMQRSLIPQKSTQNGYSFPSDNYSLYPQQVEQSQGSNYSPFAQIPQQQQQQPRNGFQLNGQHHDRWRDLDSERVNTLAMSELLMNERLGFNKRYNGFEDAVFRTPTSADLYNRSFDEVLHVRWVQRVEPVLNYI
ncbi:hypothetical protein QQ045_004068 [Rhodiola kirilowii]